MISNLFKSNVTVDSHPTARIHGCPDCKCRSTEHSSKLSNSFSQPYFVQSPNYSPNLYLSNHYSQHRSIEKLPINPYRSSIFGNQVKFNYSPSKSPQQMNNITFTYISPRKAKKSMSLSTKFSTKRFKERFFPEISAKQSNIQFNSLQFKRQINQVSDYSTQAKQVYTKQKTPEKHKILKLKKSKPQKRSEIILPNKRSNMIQNQQRLISDRPKLITEQLQGPRLTPIQALWAKQNQNQYQKQNSQLSKYMSSMNRQIYQEKSPSSIQYISLNSNHDSNKIIGTGSKIVEKLHSINQISPVENNQDKKYNTIESIEAFEIQKIQKQNETSINFQKQKSTKKSNIYESRNDDLDYELAKSINKELSLHYDYYYSPRSSDRSLSINVNL